MKIGINLTSLEPGKIGGMEQYIRNLIWYTANKFFGYELYLYVNPRNEHTFTEMSNIHKIVITENQIDKEYQMYKSITERCIDIWFCPLLNLEPKYLNIPSVVTIPDLQHEFYPKFFSKEIIQWRNKNYNYSVSKADAVLTLSEFSKKTIIDSYAIDKNKVHVIHLDSSKEFYFVIDQQKLFEAKSKYNLPDDFGFYPANTWPHKNHITLLKALKLLKDKYNTRVTIVFTGSEQQSSSEIRDYIRKNDLSDQVMFLGYIEQEDMPCIFKNSNFLVFPSLFEGFGIPLVEAMRSETPIICSSEGSIPEVVGDSALLFDPLEPEDIALKILEIKKPNQRRELVEKGLTQARKFSWETSTRDTLAVFEKIFNANLSQTMSEYPLVSIITPSYNQGKFIKETIESVLNQNYPNIEYIVMDGGSSDETVEILKSYGDRIKWVSEKDEGQADAVNKGIGVAKGEIIGWLNSDDTYLPGAVEQAVNFLRNHQEVGMVYGEGYHTKENGEIIERYPTEPFNLERLAQVCFICQPTAFFRKQVFDKAGLLNKDLHLCMDYELWMRIGKVCEIAYIPYFFATSRMYEDNKTLSRRKEVFTEIIKTVWHHYQYVPLSWVYGYVDYKYGSKRNLLFYTALLLHFVHANRSNLSYCVQEIGHMLKAEFKHRLHKSEILTSRFEDGWVSKKFEVVIPIDNNHSNNRLLMEGRHLAPYKSPLTMKLFINDTFEKKYKVSDKGNFKIDIPINVTSNNLKITIVANRTFNPKKLNINDDNRELAYIIDQLKVI